MLVLLWLLLAGAHANGTGFRVDAMGEPEPDGPQSATAEATDHASMQHLFRDRMLLYCNPPHAGFETTRDGHYEAEEAVVPSAWAAGWTRVVGGLGLPSSPAPTAQLVHVHGVFRHGDRAGMTHVPGTLHSRWDCDLQGDEDVLKLLQSSTARLVSHDCLVSNATEACASRLPPPSSASRGLDPRHYRGRCESGQLTPKGVFQHQRLGQFFAKRLAQRPAKWALKDRPVRLAGEGVLLRGLADMVVSSTDYGRTALSGLAFWDGVFPRQSTETSKRTIHVVHKDHDPLLWAKNADSCPAAERSTRERHHGRFHSLPRPVQDSVEALSRWGGKSASEARRSRDMETLSLADLINTRVCHGESLPCAKGGGAHASASDRSPLLASSAEEPALRCLSSWAGYMTLAAADKHYGHQYGGPDVALRMYPALDGVVTSMERVVSGGGRRAIFRFAHDITVYPLAAALGVGNYEWPGYASRILFELWNMSLPAGRSVSLVRVLFQGEDVTHSLSCANTWRHEDRIAWLAFGGSACTLRSFRAQVDGLLGGHTTFDAACSLEIDDTVERHGGEERSADADGGGSYQAGPFD
jgi:hypothetical protein